MPELEQEKCPNPSCDNPDWKWSCRRCGAVPSPYHVVFYFDGKPVTAEAFFLSLLCAKAKLLFHALDSAEPGELNYFGLAASERLMREVFEQLNIHQPTGEPRGEGPSDA